MELLSKEAAGRVRELEVRARTLRDERNRARKVAEAAKEAVATLPEEAVTDSQIEAARAAAKAVAEIDVKLEETQQDLIAQLGTAGRQNGLGPLGDGWEIAAGRLNLQDGDLRVDVPAQSLLAQLPVTPPVSTPPPAAYSGSGVGDMVRTRWLHPVLNSDSFSASGDLVATDFTVTPNSVSGQIKVAPVTDTEKAKLPASFALATPTASVYAVIAENVPAMLFNSRAAVQAFLGREVARALNERIDQEVIATIEAANPPGGSQGDNLVEAIRYAVAAFNDLGGSPSHLCLTPQEAAALDLTTDEAGSYVFSIRAAGDSSPVWNLQVRECPTVSHPTLVDVGSIGVGYWGEGSVMVDPYGANLGKNEVSIRAEVAAVPLHVRNIAQGAYVIGTGS